MITINKQSCTKCSQCVRVCPFGILKMKEGYPYFITEKSAGCLGCSHCAAICPSDSITLAGIQTNQEISQKNFVSEEAYTLLTAMIKQRRSIRNYKEDLVPKEVIDEILHTVKWAPSAKNQHPTKWMLISGKKNTDAAMSLVLEWVKTTGQSPEILREYEQGKNVVTCDAPHLLLAYCREDAINPTADSAIALTDAELLFYAKGLGTCFAGYLARIANAYLPLLQYFQIPHGYKIYGALMFGYPKAETYLKIPAR